MLDGRDGDAVGIADHGRKTGGDHGLGAGFDAAFALHIGAQEQDAGVDRRRQYGGADPLPGVQPYAGEHGWTGQGVLMWFEGARAQGRTR